VATAAGRGGAVATESGTAALHASLVALGVRPGDAVVMPSLTFIATANAVAYCHARPVFLDVAAESWTLDPGALRGFLETACERRGDGVRHKESGARIAAVICVHTLGHAADMDSLEAITAEHGLPLLADAAAALGSTYRERPATARGTLAAISFNGNKTVTCGGGGAIVGDDAELLRAVRHLTTTARRGPDYDHDRVGFNYRMTNLSAAVGCAQLERMGELVGRKRAIAARYDRSLAGLAGVRPFPRAPWGESACWFGGFVAGDDCPVGAGAIIDALSERGIGARRFWKPMHLQAPYADCTRGPLGVTEAVWRQIVTLPSSTQLTQEQQSTVVDEVRAIVETRR
jgi:dTDP-4-amino-4,6-dideoxygalactose transaminase